MLITNARIYSPVADWDAGWLLWRDRTIVALGRGVPPASTGEPVIDARGLHLLPGFVDIHVHGGAGHDVMDATPEALAGMATFLAEHGVTAFTPTTLTHTRGHIMAALAAIQAAMADPPPGATIVGAHLEGPYLNVEKCGAQNPEYIRLPERDEVGAILDTGIMRLVDVAPEFEANQWVIAECVRRGITVSVAHSSATYEQMQHAFALGLSHSTHTYNAQTPLLHRAPGIVGAVLTAPGVNCELIADNIHVAPAAMRVLWLAKRPHGVILISDAVRGAGMPDGEYQFDERMVVVRDGAVRMPDGTLAGSTLTLDRALRNFLAATGESLAAVWPCSSLNAARALGFADRKGSLEPHKDADLVLVDDDIQVHLTVVEGRIVCNRL